MIRPENDAADPTPSDVEVGKILDHLLGCWSRGEVIDEDEILQNYPAYASEVRGHLEMIRTMKAPESAIDRLVQLRVLRPSPDTKFAGELGPFKVYGLLGEGGMGIVLRAYDVHLERTVALKILKPESAKEEKARRRFMREAKAAARLEHPNIVTIYGVSECEGTNFIVMEHVDGPSLAEIILRHGLLGTSTCRSYFVQILTGLAAAHDAGLVHRDLKPSNVLLKKKSNTLKIADFGLARVNDAQTLITAPSAIVGSPPYMSPEQFDNSEAVDYRSDLYSAGVVLYEMLTGVVPFSSPTTSGLIHQILHDKPMDPRSRNLETDPILSAVALRLMAKKPRERFHTANHALEALYQRPLVPARRPGRLAKLSLIAAAALVVFLVLVISGVGSHLFSGKPQPDRPTSISHEPAPMSNVVLDQRAPDPIKPAPLDESAESRHAASAGPGPDRPPSISREPAPKSNIVLGQRAPDPIKPTPLGESAELGHAEPVALGSAASGSDCVVHEIDKLVGGGSDFFADSIAISGSAAVIGASFDADQGNQAGAAFVFRYNGSRWVREAKLVASDGHGGDHAGQSVAIAGNWAFVGARYTDRVFIYHFNGSIWAQAATLVPADGGGKYFGSSLAADGDWVVVGAMKDALMGEETGAAYVFHFDGATWVQSQKLIASGAAAYDQFSGERALSIYGNTIAVGAPVNLNHKMAAGAVHVFHYDGANWQELPKKLTATDGTDGNYFGGSVHLNGNLLIVGATLDDCSAGSDCGSAYVFRYDSSQAGWTQEAKLTASDAAASDDFGISVALEGETAVIGAHATDDHAFNSGSAYVFHRRGGIWQETGKLSPSDGTANAYFGASAAMFGDSALVGAYGASPSAVFVFSGLTDRNANGRLDACDLSASEYMMWYDGLGKGNAYNYIESIGLARGAGTPLSPATATWMKEPGNPVIPGSAPPSWYFQPSVVQESDGSFRMWMSHNDEIYHATSTNGVTWSVPASVVPRHAFSIGAPCVIKEGPLYKMWFHAMNGGGVHGSSWIEYATSSDGLAWTKHGVVLTQGATYDSWGMYTPAVIKDGASSYKMYYCASTQRGDNWIALATSADGVAWSKQGVVLAGDSTGFDAAATFPSGALHENGVYWLFYAGRTGDQDNVTRLGVAWSTNGVDFQRQATPLLPLGGTNEFDNQQILGVSILRVHHADSD